MLYLDVLPPGHAQAFKHQIHSYIHSYIQLSAHESICLGLKIDLPLGMGQSLGGDSNIFRSLFLGY